MNELLLTPEEITVAFNELMKEKRSKALPLDGKDYFRYGTKAQLNKVLKWMDEPCIEHKIDTGIIIRPYYEHPDTHNLYYSYHKDCPECWQRALVPE